MEDLILNVLNIKNFTDLFFKRLLSLSPSRKYLVAFSGGMDSHVLLQLMSEQPDISVRALHVHHGLQKEADGWVGHCQLVCNELNIPLESVHLNLDIQSGESIEAVARDGRYEALENSLQDNEVLLTGHHQRDQAETFLLQLFRGAGVQGLASMPKVSDFAKGQHIRPLLNESYEALNAYAVDKGLNFIQDPSNHDNHFDRNFLRNEILPQLRGNWRGLDKTISRSAGIQSETKSLLDEVAEELLQLFPMREALSINHLLALSHIKQKLVLRYWINEKGFLAPSEVKISHIISDVLFSKEDARPLVKWSGVEVRRFKNQLYCNEPLTEHDNTQIISWDGRNSLTLRRLGVQISPHVLDDLSVENLPLTVRFRQGGEKFYSHKSGHSKSLKSLLNKAGIPPWLRDRVPLIYSGGKLIHIIGLERK